MSDHGAITETLRARLAAESLLTQRQRELMSANSKIAAHARALTDEVIERRREAAKARSAAENLKGKNREALLDLRRARSEVQIAERRLWASLETIQDGFAVFDREHRIVTANRAFFVPFEDLECVSLGVTYEALVDILIEEGIVDPGDMRGREWSIWMKDRWQSDEIDPVTLRFWNDRFARLTERRTEDGDIVMLAINMTDTMRREQELEEARHKAEAASRAKSAFLANMSHEIRTPMNGVLAMADILDDGALNDEQKLCVETIKSSGEALLVIINDVLDYSKIEAAKVTLIEEPFDLEQAINEVATLLSPAAREKSLSLVVDYDMFLPTGFVGDKGRIRQVIMNLVGNAVKFTPAGHVVVRVVGLPEEGGARWRLHVTIEDTGVGIPADKVDHIFGEFNQADNAMSRQFDGTGLGLSITQRIVQLMGGEIWVDSEEGEGSVFGFRIVLETDAGAGTDEADLCTGGRRLVLLDPDPASRSVLAKQLMALGLKPDMLADGSIDAAPAKIKPGDLVVIADSEGPTGRVRMGVGPEAAEPDNADALTLQRPVLRRDLLGALRSVLPLAGRVGETPEPAPASTDPAPGPVDPDRRGAAALAAVQEPAEPPEAPETTTRAGTSEADAVTSEADAVTPAMDEPIEPAGPAPRQAAGHAPPPEKIKETDQGRVMRVLAAEDNKTNRLVLEKLLKSLDIDLILVEDGAEAVEAYCADPPDIVLTDISMPRVDGKDATRAMRAHEAEKGLPRVPIIAMTAHVMDEDRAGILAAGVDDILTKPLKKDALVRAIADACPEGARAPLPAGG